MSHPTKNPGFYAFAPLRFPGFFRPPADGRARRGSHRKQRADRLDHGCAMSAAARGRVAEKRGGAASAGRPESFRNCLSQAGASRERRFAPREGSARGGRRRRAACRCGRSPARGGRQRRLPLRLPTGPRQPDGRATPCRAPPRPAAGAVTRARAARPLRRGCPKKAPAARARRRTKRRNPRPRPRAPASRAPRRAARRVAAARGRAPESRRRAARGDRSAALKCRVRALLTGHGENTKTRPAPLCRWPPPLASCAARRTPTKTCSRSAAAARARTWTASTAP